MKRRNFLKIFPVTAVTPVVVNGFPMRPFANSRMAKILTTCDGVEDRILIMVQLGGGNDGVNTVIPLAQYDTYANLRPSIRIEEGSLISLDTTLSNENQLGLHPSLGALKEMYDKGWASIVQGAGYEDMNQSHFKGTDLWMTGGDTTPENSNIKSGWMGRALQAFYPDVAGAPTTDMPDPLGIQVGDTTTALGFHTETEHQNVINLSGQDPAGFFSLVQTIGGAPILNVPDSDQGDELSFIMSVEQSVSLYSQRITTVFNNGSNALNDYPTDQFAAQLKTVARLIKGGCKTKIYLCKLGGFDTHSGQVDTTSTLTGDHANLLATLGNAIKYFFDDLEAMGLADQVVACTFSEFGRCARENGSNGTDHGTLAPMFLFGKHINAGVLGTNVDLSDLTNDNQLRGLQHDYRQVFTTLLQDWLGANSDILVESMFEGYNKVSAIDSAAIVDPSCYWGTITATDDPFQQKRRMSLFPNPASATTEVAFYADMPFDARLTLHSLGGNLISAANVRVMQGENLFYLEVINLPPGSYFVRIENKLTGKAEVAKLSVVRA